jgi:hypothetical protein
MLPMPDKPVIKALLTLGVLAGEFGLFDDAEVLYRGVAVGRPDLPHPDCGMAMLYFMRGQVPEAVEACHRVLRKHPHLPVAQSVASLIFRNAGVTGWQDLAREAIADGSDQGAVEIAMAVLRDGGLATDNEAAKPWLELPIGASRC